MLQEKAPETQGRCALSIIIPVHNAGRTLRNCLDAITRSRYRSFECIVVDDYSSDDSLQIAEEFDVQIIRLPEHHGAAFGRNRGAEAASADILVFIDADVVIYPDTLEKVRHIFEANSGIDAVFGSYDDQPASTNFLSQYKNLFHHHIHQTSRQDAETYWTACGAIRKACFWEVGGFDKTMRMMEDIDLGYRLRKRNFAIRLDKDIQVKHLKKYSFTGLIKSDLLDRAIPWTVLILRRGGAPNDLNLRWWHKCSAVLAIILLLCLLLSLVSKWFLAGFCIAGLIFFFLNRSFYRFYIEKRGLLFALRVIPLHVLYYLYSTFGFMAGFCLYKFSRHSVPDNASS
jgi:glycosyltransferase involved in cell wall biosynthesis